MKAEQDAAKAALKAAWISGRTYDMGSVPASPVTPYQDVAVNLGTPKGDRAAGISSSRSFRAVVRSFGRSFAEVSFAAEKADAALLGQRIGAGYSPCRAEVSTSVIRDPDGGGLLMAVRTYTFHKTA